MTPESGARRSSRLTSQHSEQNHRPCSRQTLSDSTRERPAASLAASLPVGSCVRTCPTRGSCTRRRPDTPKLPVVYR